MRAARFKATLLKCRVHNILRLAANENHNSEGKKMKSKEYFTQYVLENGKITPMKISKKEAMKDIKQILKEDKDFLEIMAKM